MSDEPIYPSFTFQPLTTGRWDDFERLFGPRGAVGGCWCMWFRITHKQFDTQRGEGNRQAMQTIVTSGEVPGILAYDGDQPVGWCSVAPRQAFSVLGRSPVAKPVDDQPVWSIVCFFVAKSHRKQGLMTALLRAALDFAKANGAMIVEGYPVDPTKGSTPDVYAYTGLAAAFENVGFVEVARRSPTRPIMRYFY